MRTTKNQVSFLEVLKGFKFYVSTIAHLVVLFTIYTPEKVVFAVDVTAVAFHMSSLLLPSVFV